MVCPACNSSETSLVRTHSVDAAAHHHVPARRDRERNDQLRVALRELFDGDQVEVWRCGDCGFWFADPFIAGTPDIYNLITAGQEHYPAHRFEFELTLEALPARPMSILEIGAGRGAFMRRAQSAGVVRKAVATEYDRGSLAAIAALPDVEAVPLTPSELAAQTDQRFDAVCMFQVLEHMDRVDDVFSALRRLTAQDGELFIGVPNEASVTMQEELTGFWEMPPNHVSRWTPAALQSIAGRHGFRLIEHRYEPAPRWAALAEMAQCRFQGRAYDPSSVAGRVNDIPVRAVRGPLKRLLYTWDLLAFLPTLGQWPPRSQWFRLGAA